MKTTLFLIYLCFTTFSFANDSTSTEIKLKQYKDMFSEGLINETEYSKLKQNLLFPDTNKDKNVKPIVTDKDISEIKKEYIQNFAGGSVLLAAGISGIGGGVYYKNKKIPNVFNYVSSNGNINESSFNAALQDYKVKKIIIFTISAVSAGAGIVLEILGVHNRSIYLNKKKDISLGMSNEGIGASIRFN